MMHPLTYFLTLIISLAGLGTGIMLAFMAREELESVRKYLVLAKKLLLGGIFGVLGFAYSGSIGTGILFFLLGFGAVWFIMHDEIKAYLILGGVFFGCSFLESMFALAASLIIAYGFAAGTLLVHTNAKAIRKDRCILARKASAAGIAYLAAAGLLYLMLSLIAA